MVLLIHLKICQVIANGTPLRSAELRRAGNKSLFPTKLCQVIASGTISGFAKLLRILCEARCIRAMLA